MVSCILGLCMDPEGRAFRLEEVVQVPLNEAKQVTCTTFLDSTRQPKPGFIGGPIFAAVADDEPRQWNQAMSDGVSLALPAATPSMLLHGSELAAVAHLARCLVPARLQQDIDGGSVDAMVEAISNVAVAAGMDVGGFGPDQQQQDNHAAAPPQAASLGNQLSLPLPKEQQQQQQQEERTPRTPGHKGAREDGSSSAEAAAKQLKAADDGSSAAAGSSMPSAPEQPAWPCSSLSFMDCSTDQQPPHTAGSMGAGSSGDAADAAGAGPSSTLAQQQLGLGHQPQQQPTAPPAVSLSSISDVGLRYPLELERTLLRGSSEPYAHLLGLTPQQARQLSPEQLVLKYFDKGAAELRSLKDQPPQGPGLLIAKSRPQAISSSSSRSSQPSSDNKDHIFNLTAVILHNSTLELDDGPEVWEQLREAHNRPSLADTVERLKQEQKLHVITTSTPNFPHLWWEHLLAQQLLPKEQRKPTALLLSKRLKVCDGRMTDESPAAGSKQWAVGRKSQTHAVAHMTFLLMVCARMVLGQQGLLLQQQQPHEEAAVAAPVEPASLAPLTFALRCSDLLPPGDSSYMVGQFNRCKLPTETA